MGRGVEYGGGGGLNKLTVYLSFLKRPFIDVKNDEGVVVL